MVLLSECRKGLSFWGPFWILLHLDELTLLSRSHKAFWEWQPDCLSSVRSWILSYNLTKSFIVTEKALDLYSRHSFCFELSLVKVAIIKMRLLLSNSSENRDIRAYRMVLLQKFSDHKYRGAIASK